MLSHCVSHSDQSEQIKQLFACSEREYTRLREGEPNRTYGRENWAWLVEWAALLRRLRCTSLRDCIAFFVKKCLKFILAGHVLFLSFELKAISIFNSITCLFTIPISIPITMSILVFARSVCNCKGVCHVMKALFVVWCAPFGSSYYRLIFSQEPFLPWGFSFFHFCFDA